MVGHWRSWIYWLELIGKITTFKDTLDGRYLIELNGLARFKITKEIKNNKSYRECEISFEDYQAEYGKRAIPLFAFNTKRQLQFFTEDHSLIPEKEWTIVALIQAKSDADNSE